jgi:hypothetical protein
MINVDVELIILPELELEVVKINKKNKHENVIRTKILKDKKKNRSLH